MINKTECVEGKSQAADRLETGDVILQAAPVVLGPGTSQPAVCLGCLKPGPDLVACPSCTWPCCSVECIQASQDHRQECQLLKTAGVKCKIENFTEKTTALDFITPLRLLMKGFKTSGNYQSTINDENVIKFIKKIKKEVAEKDIIEAIAYSKKNSIPLEFGCQGIYEVLSNLQHCCSPNTYFNVLKSREILFRAAEDIEKGESINFCKADLMKCNYFRRKQLHEMSIECSCRRCLDGTEFDTNFGSLRCLECEALLSPVSQTEWSCSNCKEKKSSKQCEAALEKLNTELKRQSEDADYNKETVLQFEKILERENEWREIPENSQFLQDVRYRLIFIYQYHKYFYHDDEEYLRKKIRHCKEWIQLSEKLYRGRNYGRIHINFEMMSAAVALMLCMKQNCYPVSEVNSYITEIVKMASDPIKMLVDEEDGSLLKAFRNLVVMSTEAREEQKRRVIISQWDDEEW